MSTYTIHWGFNSYTLTFRGNISFHDLIAANDDLTSTDPLDSITSYVVDFSAVESIEMTDRELKVYARYDAVMPLFLRRNSIRGALIAPCRNIADMLHDFLEFGHQSWDRRVFSCTTDAFSRLHRISGQLIDESSSYDGRLVT
jgi:hypothetical protein